MQWVPGLDVDKRNASAFETSEAQNIEKRTMYASATSYCNLSFDHGLDSGDEFM